MDETNAGGAPEIYARTDDRSHRHLQCRLRPLLRRLRGFAIPARQALHRHGEFRATVLRHRGSRTLAPPRAGRRGDGVRRGHLLAAPLPEPVWLSDHRRRRIPRRARDGTPTVPAGPARQLGSRPAVSPLRWPPDPAARRPRRPDHPLRRVPSRAQSGRDPAGDGAGPQGRWRRGDVRAGRRTQPHRGEPTRDGRLGCVGERYRRRGTGAARPRLRIQPDDRGPDQLAAVGRGAGLPAA